MDDENDKKKQSDTKGKSPSSAIPGSGETNTLLESEGAAPKGGHAKAKTGQLVGKINNLITTDASTIQGSYTIITLCEFPEKRVCVYSSC